MSAYAKAGVVFLAMVMMVPAARGQEQSAAELAKAAQNPVANMMSFPFQNNTSFGIGPYDRAQNVLNIQPVIPLMDGRLITRTIIPVVWQPDIASESGTDVGLGDINFTAFYSPETQGLTLGFGPVLSIPTGGELRGTQKWALGPSLVVLATPGQWVTGVLINNIWSIAGKAERPDVNRMLLQPFLNYNVGTTGWYISVAPIITADWKAESSNRWIVPLGGTVGKLSRIGSRGLPVNIQAGAFYNVVKPDLGPKWSTRLQVQILLPA